MSYINTTSELVWPLGMSSSFLAELLKKPKTIGAFQQNQQPFLKKWH
jgi:hypothetical protein